MSTAAPGTIPETVVDCNTTLTAPLQSVEPLGVIVTIAALGAETPLVSTLVKGRCNPVYPDSDYSTLWTLTRNRLTKHTLGLSV
jgi:hypothetical protein